MRCNALAVAVALYLREGIAGLLDACADIECVLVCVSTVWFCVFTVM